MIEVIKFRMKILSYLIIIPWILLCPANIAIAQTEDDSLDMEFVVDSSYINEDEIVFGGIESLKGGHSLLKAYRRDSSLVTVKTYLENDTILDGETIDYYPGNKIKRLKTYRNGKLDGKYETYYESGVLRRRDFYENGEFLQGECYDKDGNPEDYHPVEDIPPQFNQKYVQSKIKYPENLLRAGIEDKFIIKILIDKDGKIIKFRYSKNSHHDFLVEVFKKILLYGKCSPARIDGEPIISWAVFPITFKLKE